MSHSFFAYIFRMRYIARWALMRNTRTENVEEHSYEVAVLAHALAVIGREIFRKDLDPDKAAAAALFHDAPEIITGDMPTPVKYHSGALTAAYKEVERGAAEKLVSMLPVELRGAYEPLISGDVGEENEQLVKAADRLSALIKCIEERRSGNLEFADAEKGGFQPVPQHLRDTHYRGAETLGSGQGYRYVHDYPGHFVLQQYRPLEAGGFPYYVPSQQGFENEIRSIRAARGFADPPDAPAGE